MRRMPAALRVLRLHWLAFGFTALFFMVIVARWPLAHYAAPVSTGVSGSIGVDSALVAASVLALAARSRGITVLAAASMVARRALRQAGPDLPPVPAVAPSS